MFFVVLQLLSFCTNNNAAYSLTLHRKSMRHETQKQREILAGMWQSPITFCHSYCLISFAYLFNV